MSGYSTGLAPMQMLRCRYGVDSAQKHRSALFSLLCGLFHSKMAAVSWRQLENVSATLLALKKTVQTTTNNVSGVFTRTTPESVKKKKKKTKNTKY